jgi:hypothetical protein
MTATPKKVLRKGVSMRIGESQLGSLAAEDWPSSVDMLSVVVSDRGDNLETFDDLMRSAC